MVVTTLVAAVEGGIGASLEVPEGGETLPLSGIAFVTGVFSLVGVVTGLARSLRSLGSAQNEHGPRPSRTEVGSWGYPDRF